MNPADLARDLYGTLVYTLGGNGDFDRDLSEQGRQAWEAVALRARELGALAEPKSETLDLGALQRQVDEVNRRSVRDGMARAIVLEMIGRGRWEDYEECARAAYALADALEAEGKR